MNLIIETVNAFRKLVGEGRLEDCSIHNGYHLVVLDILECLSNLISNGSAWTGLGAGGGGVGLVYIGEMYSHWEVRYKGVFGNPVLQNSILDFISVVHHGNTNVRGCKSVEHMWPDVILRHLRIHTHVFLKKYYNGCVKCFYFVGIVNLIITIRKWSCGKVMFSQACVKNSVHRGGGVCQADISLGQTPT